jgi:hypothetical protein
MRALRIPTQAPPISHAAASAVPSAACENIGDRGPSRLTVHDGGYELIFPSWLGAKDEGSGAASPTCATAVQSGVFATAISGWLIVRQPVRTTTPSPRLIHHPTPLSDLVIYASHSTNDDFEPRDWEDEQTRPFFIETVCGLNFRSVRRTLIAIRGARSGCPHRRANPADTPFAQISATVS